MKSQSPIEKPEKPILPPMIPDLPGWTTDTYNCSDDDEDEFSPSQVYQTNYFDSDAHNLFEVRRNNEI